MYTCLPILHFFLPRSLCCPLQANADPSVISCMHNLSRRIAIALQHEERRCQYLTREAKLMLAVQDELTTMTESEAFKCTHNTAHSSLYLLMFVLCITTSVYYPVVQRTQI